MWLLVFCLLCIALFLVSRMVTRSLSLFFLLLFKSHTPAIFALSFLFLPGVILHELSHLLMASILFVPTGEIEFLPEVRGTEVKMGSVAIGSTDPVRRFLIGVAPIIGGIGVLLLLFSFLAGSIVLWKNILLLYCIFEIANTMFSSKKDMEGALGLLFGLGLILLAMQVLGISIVLLLQTWIFSSTVNLLFFHMGELLAIALGIDLGILLFAKGLLAVGRRIN